MPDTREMPPSLKRVDQLIAEGAPPIVAFRRARRESAERLADESGASARASPTPSDGEREH
jgi:hypothetical protein